MKIFVCCSLLLLCVGPLASAAEISHANPRFKFIVPPGFQIEATERRVVPEIRPLLKYSSVFKGDRITLHFSGLSQEIPEVEGTQDERAIHNLDISLIPWKEHRIGFKWEDVRDGRHMAVAMVPLKGEGLGVGVLGKSEHREELQRVLLEVLATVDGPTNWKTDSERAVEFVTNPLTVAAVVVLVGILLFMTVCKRAKPLTPPPAASGTPSASNASSAETPGRNDSGM